MNEGKIRDYINDDGGFQELGDGEQDFIYLKEVARRMGVLVDRDLVFGLMSVFVELLFDWEILFSDGFVVNDLSDLNWALGVSGASAVVASLVDRADVGWVDVERKYFMGTSSPERSMSELRGLVALISKAPGVVVVR